MFGIVYAENCSASMNAGLSVCNIARVVYVIAAAYIFRVEGSYRGCLPDEYEVVAYQYFHKLGGTDVEGGSLAIIKTSVDKGKDLVAVHEEVKSGHLSTKVEVYQDFYNVRT